MPRCGVPATAGPVESVVLNATIAAAKDKKRAATFAAALSSSSLRRELCQKLARRPTL